MKSNFKKLALFAYMTSVLALNPSFSAEIPVASEYDARVQEVVYNPNNVTVVKVKSGVATLIQLSPNEYIGGDASGFATGFPLAWNVSVKQNNIFVRPINENPDTNVVFTTNKRTYVISLTSVQDGEEPTYYLKYKYPMDELAERQAKEAEQRAKNKAIYEEKQRVKQELTKEPPCTSTPYLNMDYYVRGSENITPMTVWDDGIFTCFKWHKSKDLPVIYRLLPDGTEVLTNTHMDKNIMVVQEISNHFVLRAGESVAEVKTKTTNASRNEKRTTVKNQALISK